MSRVPVHVQLAFPYVLTEAQGVTKEYVLLFLSGTLNFLVCWNAFNHLFLSGCST
jgi:hypothetical protein